MAVSKQQVLDALPKYENRRVPIVDDQKVRDIISTMLDAHREFEPLYDKIGYLFIEPTLKDTCDALFDFCKQNLRYKEESERLQTVNAPQVLVTLGYCDCKGYASFICGCLSAIERYTGQRIPWEYCFASYRMAESTPYHVFCIVKTKTGSLWVDPTPGAAKKSPMWWFRRKVKSGNMALVKVIGKLERGSVNGVGAAYPGSGDTIYAGPIPATSAGQAAVAEAALLNPNVDQVPLQQYPQITQNIDAAPMGDPGLPITNTAAVPANTEASTKNWLLLGAIAAGLGGVYYLDRSGGRIGKKNKKSSLTPVLLIGGAAAAYWYFFMRDATPVVTTQLPAVTNGGASPAGTAEYVPTGAIMVSPEVAVPVSDSEVHNAIYNYDSQYRYGIDRMSADWQRALYQYFFGYLKKGLRLYNSPGYFTDGWYNPALYAQIVALSKPWGWHIIN